MTTAIRRRGRHAAPGRRTLRDQRDALAAECRALAEENEELRALVAQLTASQAPAPDRDECLTHIAGACDGTTRDCVHRQAPAPQPEQPGPDSEDTVTLPRPTVARPTPRDMATGLAATTTHRVMWLGASPLATVGEP